MKYLLPALKLKIFMTILLGLLYPFAMTGVSQVIFPKQAGGDFITRNGQFVGSRSIGQKFEKEIYFWSRPSAVDYNPLPSGGSNLGPTSLDLKKSFDERLEKLKRANPDEVGEPPQDLLFASASGLDPHISSAAAKYQISRIAKARSISHEQIQGLIEQATQKSQWGIFGESTVNVLALNISLDQFQSNVPAASSGTGDRK